MQPKIAQLITISFILLIQFNLLGNAPLNDANMQKLHPKFRVLMVENSASPMFKKGNAISSNAYFDKNGNERHSVIIRTRNVSELQSMNIHVNSVFPDFVTAKVTLNEISKISKLNSVKFIDAPSISYSKMNVSAPVTGATLLQNSFYNNTEYAGEGAIVVIYDTGIDFNHIDFKNQDDTTKSRILYIWDQTLRVPLPGESNPSGFNYGVEYTQTHINDEIDGSPAGYVRQVDSNGHGTHVAGTAAGSGVKFGGIAPKADIIVVKGGNGSFPDDDIIDGITYAENKAAALGKPVVINLSLGGHSGPHDGSEAHEQAIDLFSSKAGQAAIVAAGNEGDQKIHIEGAISSGGSVSFQINVPPAYTPNEDTMDDEFIFELWYDENESVLATVTSPPPNSVSYSRGFGTFGSPIDDTDGKIYLENRQVNGIKQRIQLYVYDQTSGKEPASGTWTLTLESASGNLSYDGWLARSDLGGENASLLNGDVNKTVAMPGTANEAITVGAYVTRLSWPAIDGYTYNYHPDFDFDYIGGIANFSSLGPTRDSRLKPEITAPGKATVSTYSSDSDASEQAINPNGKHVRLQGTSMATPHIAGAVAVLFGIDVGMTVSQIKALLANTAVKDVETGSSRNNTWGDGKLDLLKAVISKVSGDQSVTRTVQKYFSDESGPYYPYSGKTKLAVRYTAAHDGRLTGAFFELVGSHPDVTNPVVDGNSTLELSIHSDNGGEPGTQLGNTVFHPFSMLDPGTNNYINLLDANVSLSKDQIYYIVLNLTDRANSLKVLFDDGDTAQSENYSLIMTFTSWQRPEDTFAEPNNKPYNLLLSSEIVDIGPAASIGETEKTIARTFELEQNYPNPFNPSTKIRFSLSQNGQVDLTIFDILGRKVVTMIDEIRSAGVHEIEWNSRNTTGSRVPSGVYFYRLRSNEGVLTKKMLLVK